MPIETKNCHVHHCLANSRTFQDLASRFPGPRSFSRTFHVLENFPMTIPGTSRRHGNPDNCEFHSYIDIAFKSVMFHLSVLHNILCFCVEYSHIVQVAVFNYLTSNYINEVAWNSGKLFARYWGQFILRGKHVSYDNNYTHRWEEMACSVMQSVYCAFIYWTHSVPVEWLNLVNK